jgi:hypothetical protein
MAGLVPAIHVFTLPMDKKDMAARHKAGHDDALSSQTRTHRGNTVHGV